MNTLYTPLDNFFFYKVMGEKGDEVQLLGFINAVLHRTGENRFRSVEILENKTFSAKVKGDKSNTLDVRAVLQDSTRTNIELQILSEISDNVCYPMKNIIRADYVKSIGVTT